MLAPLLQAEPELAASLPDDELLALLLMAERRAGKRSFWWPYLRCVRLMCVRCIVGSISEWDGSTPLESVFDGSNTP